MNNIVAFRTGPSRSPRPSEAAEGGARILFFTGVRYVREDADEGAPSFVPDEIGYDDALLPPAATASADGLEFAAR